MTRLFWLCLGLMSVALGATGVFVPLLPTVPFMLLAAFCFARSSERLHDWLINHRTFGQSIRDWQDHGAIHKRAKRLATLSILLVLGASFVFGAPSHVIAIQVVVLSIVLIFIWTRPTGPR